MIKLLVRIVGNIENRIIIIEGIVMKYGIIFLQILGLLFCGVSGVLASEEHHEHHEQHEKHVHGEGQLNLAVDGSELQIELHIPAMNIVGFEHKPNNSKQKQAILDAVDLLQNTQKIFVIPNEAKCRVEHVKAYSTLENKHDEENEHHGKDEHHEDEHHEEGEQTHSEFEAEYHFECDSMQNLHQVSVRLFEHFTSLEELAAQIITPKRQTAQELTSRSSMIHLND